MDATRPAAQPSAVKTQTVRLNSSLVILLFMLFSAGCNTESQQPRSERHESLPHQAASAPPQEKNTPPPLDELAKHRERAASDDAESVEEAVFHGVARALVIRHVEPNKLGVSGQEFRVKGNPVGPGCFVYDPRTRFAGVERYLVWLVLDDSRAYALNSPAKMVTPSLKWPRDDGVLTPSTGEVVAYVFDGASLSAPNATDRAAQSDRPTFTVLEYRVYRAVIDAPLSVSESEAVRRAAAAHGVTPTAAKEIADRVQRILFENNWFGSAESEIKHASDWRGQAR
ncbi:MAG: hypothetical protein AB1725_09085 [Armatimonadota bacterium]